MTTISVEDRPSRRADPRAWPWWGQVLAVYAASRVLTTLGFAAALAGQEPAAAMPERSLPVFVGAWYDGTWYREIALHGYPRELPVGPDGTVPMNVWAFYPLYPLLVRGVMAVTGGDWTLVAPLTSVVLGAVAMLLVHRLLADAAPGAVAARPGLPLATVAVLSVYPASPVLQAGYSESLALLLVALALLLVVRRRYLAAVPVALALGLARPVALPLALVVAVHAAMRWRAARAGTDRLGPGALAGLAALGAAAVVSGLAWPAICQAVTGVPDAYLRTQQAWREGRGIAPFSGWSPILADRPWLAVAWALGAVAVVALLAHPAGRRLGPELVAWVVGYLGYLAAVLEPNTTSVVRFGLLAFPLAAAVVGLVPRPPGRARAWTAGLGVACLVAQAAWLWWLWRYTAGDTWTPAP